MCLSSIYLPERFIIRDGPTQFGVVGTADKPAGQKFEITCRSLETGLRLPQETSVLSPKVFS